MKVAVATYGRALGVMDHMGLDGQVELANCIFYDCAMPQRFVSDRSAINTSIPVMNLLKHPEFRSSVLGEIEKGAPQGLWYSLFNGKDFGPWLHFAYSPYFMAGDVSVALEWSQGIGQLAEVDPALQEQLAEVLQDLEYRGEVLLAQQQVHFGHFPGPMSLYYKLTKGNLVRFLLQDGYLVPRLGELAASVLASIPPFPFAPGATQILMTPAQAKNIWRQQLQPHQVLLALGTGDHKEQAKKQVLRVLGTLRKQNAGLQYRVDVGSRLRLAVQSQVP